MKIIGIDLGTTNSAVSVYEMGASRTLQLRGEPTIPSVVWVNQNGDLIVGREAKHRVSVDPEHILISTKRDLGSDKTYVINGETYTPTEVATIILRYLKVEAGKELNDEINDVVVTVPAYFGFQEIGEIQKAAMDAGLNPRAIIPEPTAAAIRYGIDMNSHQTICVIDLGGGTFDVTVLEVKFDKKQQKHVITPVNWDGDHYLGGDDFDNAIIDWMINNGAEGFKNKLELKPLAEAAKIDLASLTETEISHPVYLATPIVLTLTQYKNLIKDKLEQIGSTIKKTISESVIEGDHIGIDDINRFILVGGSCKHPLVKDHIRTIIGKEPYAAPNIDTFVTQGAALYHHALTTPTSNISVPIKLPKTLGTDLSVDGVKINAILLNKGTELPSRAIQIACLSVNAPMLRSYVVEGEKRLFKDNKEIDVIEIPLKRTNEIHPIVTEFIIDDSSVLSFNTYVIEINKKTKESVQSLFDAAKGEANLIENDLWDKFHSQHPNYVKKEHKSLTLNISD